MKPINANVITTMQFIFLIHGTQLGVGMLQIPRVLAEQAGTDGWMAILINWIFSSAIGLLIILIMKRNPEKTLPLLLQSYFGKWAGSLITIVFIIFFTLTAATEILREMLFVKVWLLPETPDYIILLSFAIPGYMILRGGIRVMGRYAELAFFFMLWLPLIYLMPLSDGTWLNLLPIFKEGAGPILDAAIENSYSFFGSEIAFFLYPMLKNKQYASIGIVAGNTLTMAAYMLATIVCFVYFGPDAITRYNEPSVSVLKTVEFRFIERMEIILFAFYLLAVFKTWISFIWAATFSVGQLEGKTDHRKYVLLFLVIMVLYTLFFYHTFDQNDTLQKWIGNTSLYLAYAFPVCLYGIVLVNERFRRSTNK